MDVLYRGTMAVKGIVVCPRHRGIYSNPLKFSKLFSQTWKFDYKWLPLYSFLQEPEVQGTRMYTWSIHGTGMCILMHIHMKVYGSNKTKPYKFLIIFLYWNPEGTGLLSANGCTPEYRGSMDVKGIDSRVQKLLRAYECTAETRRNRFLEGIWMRPRVQRDHGC